jgi:putative LysE/RhtB family amino acid efflux pump
VAMQLGPMSLLLIRSTLRAGWRIGLAIGAGIALVDGVYAACGAAGVAPAIGLSPVRIVLGLAGVSGGCRGADAVWRHARAAGR